MKISRLSSLRSLLCEALKSLTGNIFALKKIKIKFYKIKTRLSPGLILCIVSIHFVVKIDKFFLDGFTFQF